MPLINPTLPSDGETADAADIVSPIQAILAVLNGGLDQDNFADEGVTAPKLAAALQQALVPAGTMLAYGGASAPTGYLLCDGSAVSRATYSALYAALGTSYGIGDNSTTFNLPDLRTRVPLGAGAGTFVISFANTDVNATTNIITVPTNVGLITGKAVVLSTSSAVPAGLTAATTYYVIRLSSTTISLATSLANAVAGTAIDITSQGTGTHTLTATLSNFARGTKGGEETHALTIDEMPSHTHDQQADNTSNNLSPFRPSVTARGSALLAAGSTYATGGSAAHNTLPPFQSVNYIVKF